MYDLCTLKSTIRIASKYTCPSGRAHSKPLNCWEWTWGGHKQEAAPQKILKKEPESNLLFCIPLLHEQLLLS